MNKEIQYDIAAREGLKRGVDALANAVKVTLGPKGRNVSIRKHNRKVNVTKDGVTVAKEIFLKDPVEDMGAQMVKEVASKTNDLAGDGTTTATVLAQAIVAEGIKNMAAGANPMDLKRGIDKAVTAIVENLGIQAVSVESSSEKIMQVATISANNDEVIGKLIAGAFEKVGKEGVITVDESQSTETYVDVVEGVQFDRGYLSSYFITNPDKMSAVLEETLILICEKKITGPKQVMPLLEKVAKAKKSILVIAEDIDSMTLNLLVRNKLGGALNVVAIKAPGFGERRQELLSDIGILTKGQVFGKHDSINLEDAEISMLGYAEKVTVTRETTTITGGTKNEEMIADQVAQIKAQLLDATTEYDINALQDRMAKLVGGVGVVYVGAVSEVEMKEKKDRIEDALHATRAALEEGIVIGGGVALIKAVHVLDTLKPDNSDEATGIAIIRKAIEAPLRCIVENAGIESSVILNEILRNEGNIANFGYNAKTGRMCDMILEGVIDPKKVTRVALENAASVAGMILTTECTLVDIEDASPQSLDDIPTSRFNI